jgi:hypothetical protein
MPAASLLASIVTGSSRSLSGVPAMALATKKVEVWTTDITDRPGSLSAKLEPLAAAGVDLGFLLARRRPEKKGAGVAFITGINTPKQAKAAKSAGWKKATDKGALRLEGANKPGAANAALSRVAAAGLNLRGASAMTIGSKFSLLLAFDSPAEAAKAQRALARK